MKYSVVFWGTPDFAVPILDMLRDESVLSAVVTQPERKQGRGLRNTVPSAVKQRAESFGVPIFEPENLKELDFVRRLQEFLPCLFVVAAYGKIIPEAILNLSTPGVINVHPSLLPKYRGPSPIQAAILNQDTATGVSLIQLDNQMDHGPLIAQESIACTPSETYETLSHTLSLLGSAMLKKKFRAYIDSTIILTPQDHTKATFCKLINSEDGLLDPAQSITVLDAQIRALQTWPGCYIVWDSRRLKIHSACIFKGYRPTKKFSKSAQGSLVMQTADGALEILELQAEGKPRMPSSAFLNGHPSILES